MEKEILFGDSAILGLYNTLQSQWESWKESPSGDFEFRINDQEARDAIKAFHQTACQGELVLDDMIYQLFRGYMAPKEDLAVTLITRGKCPTLETVLPRTDSYITQAKDIGVHIPVQEFREKMLMNLDYRLGQMNKPQCTICPHRQHREEHRTVLSYLRYCPPDLADYYDTIHDLEQNTLRLRYRLERQRAEKAEVLDKEYVDPELESLLDGHTKLLAQARNSLRRAAQENDHAVAYASTRVKGDGRLGWKLIRRLLGVDDGGGHPARDRYGIKVVVSSNRVDDAEALGEAAQSAMIALYGEECVFQKLHRHKVENNGRVVHDSFRFFAMYRSRGLYLPVESMFTTLKYDFIDKADHPYYEERQLQKLDQKRDEGIDVDMECIKVFN